MKKNTGLFCAFVFMAAICLCSQPSFGQESIPTGKDIFVGEKCDRCHSIASLNIKHTGPKEISDLSNVGSRFSEEFLIKYLNREETINGKKHLKNLKSEGADIETLSRWLATLKGK